MINKIVRKSMNKKKGLIVAITVLLVISSLFVGLSHFVYDTMENNYKQIQIDTNVEDFRLYALASDEDQLKDMYHDEFIEELEEEFAISLEVAESAKFSRDDERSYQIMKYNKDDEINTIIVEEGSLPENDNQILIQTQALEQANLKIGDKLEINDQDYEISGTGYLVEYLMPADFTNNLIQPNFDKFMPVVMNADGFDKLDRTDKELSFNYIFKGKFNEYDSLITNRLDTYKKIRSYEMLEIPVFDDNGLPQINSKGEVVTEEIDRFAFVMDRQMNLTISGVESEINSNQTTFTFLSMLLAVITIFLATILVNSVFNSQRREMGIMKAEGVSIPKLGFGFAFYMLILIIVGFLIGVYASTFAADAMRNIYDDTFMLKDYLITDNTVKTVIIQLSEVGIVMLAAIYFLSIRKNLNTPTLHLVKNISGEKAPKYNVGKLFKRMSFIRKYQLNLVLRNFSKTVLLTFAVLVSSFLLLLGALMYDAVHNMMDNIFGESFTYSYVVNYSENNIINEGEIENGYITESVILQDVPRADELEEPLTGEDSVTIEAYDFDNIDTVYLTNVDGEKITNNYDGIIASSGFMKNYNLQIGDIVTFENPYKAEEQVELKIVEETSDFFLPYAYMPLDVFQEEFNIRDDMINAYHGTEDLTTALKNDIKDQDPSAMVYENIDMEEMLGDSMDLLNITIIIIATLAAIIAFVALYSISSVIIESNSKTISVMKVLGYSTNEVRIMTIGMYKWLVILIYVASIPALEKIIQVIVGIAMADVDFALPINLNYKLSLLGLVVIIAVYLIASNLTYRKIAHIKLSESLKSDE